jgi:hypothetical protein
MLGTEYRWRGSRLWEDSLTYLGINAAVAVLSVVVGLPFLLAYLMGFFIGIAGSVAVQIAAALLIFGALFGLPSILLFVTTQRRELGVSVGRAAAAYIVVVLAANSAYLALAFGYAALAGTI